MNNQEETWKPIRGYCGRYEVSNAGRVRSWLRRGRKSYKNVRKSPVVIRQNLVSSGYMSVCLTSETGERKLIGVHRLVADSFIGRVSSKDFVCHIDDNKLNNHISNLYIGTHEDNVKDAIRNNKYISGEDHWNSKLTKEQAIFIRDSRGIITQKKLSKMFSISTQQIIRIQKNINWS